MGVPSFAVRLASGHYERVQQHAHQNAERVQSELLMRILRLYRDTELGRMLGLERITTPAQFRREIRATTPKDYAAIWEAARVRNEPGIVHPKKLACMGTSSGTSGVDKYVPYPEEQFATLKLFTNHAMFHALHALGRYDLLGEKMLVTSGPPFREVTESGVTIGYGSGLVSLRAPRFARRVVLPSRETLSIREWRPKIEKMVEESIDQDVRILTGMPNSVVPLLEHLLAEAAARGMPLPTGTVRDVWPNLALYVFSGTPLTMFETRLAALLGSDVSTFEVYSSTEVPIAYQMRPREPGLLVDLTTSVVELEPLDGSPRIGIHEARVGERYDIVSTTLGGLFAYKLGDRIEVLGTNPFVIRFAGRDREEITLGVERLALPDVRMALDAACAERGLSHGLFFVCPSAPLPDRPPTHEYYVELDDQTAHETTEALARAVDRILGERNKMYAGIRVNDTLMRPPTLSAIPRGTLERFAFTQGDFGQGKVVHLYNDRRIPERILATLGTLGT